MIDNTPVYACVKAIISEVPATVIYFSSVVQVQRTPDTVDLS